MDLQLNTERRERESRLSEKRQKETKETRQEKRRKCQRNESRVIEMRSMSLLKKMRDGQKTKHLKMAAAEVTREICFQKRKKRKKKGNGEECAGIWLTVI